jgi:two-component system, OmpR family, sensor kinase
VGKLFWKFFAFVWLTQLAGIVAVGSLFWLTERRTDAAFRDAAANPTEAAQFAAADDHRFPRRDGPPYPGGSPYPSGLPYPGGPPHPSGPPHPPPRFWLRNMPPPTALGVTLAASILTALLLAAYVAKPVRSLRSAFEAAAAGDLDRRVAPLIGGRHDELADLGRDFDRMAGRLKTSMENQRRLLHDVSHEMRSPLARLQAAAGLLRQRPDQPEIMITRMEEEIARIDLLVGELLTLSRLESGELPGAEEDVDMHDLVRGVVNDTNFEAQTEGREVVWDERGSATLRGRSELLHRAVENIIRNALKHAPESRVVRVESEFDRAAGRYLLRVLDEGRGIPQDELLKLFTPFFRGTGSARTDGYGLGLAIAGRSIQAHGGSIRAANRPQGGLCVEITLPVRGTADSNGTGARA